MNIFFTILNHLVFGIALFLIVFRFIKLDKSGEKDLNSSIIERSTIIKIIVGVIASRVILYLICWAFTHIVGYPRSLLEVWEHWDAHQYLRIVNEGYFSLEEGWVRTVFYPLYPAVVWLVKTFLVNDVVSGLAVSWSCLCGACIYLYKLVLLDWDKKYANRAVKYLLIFPVTVFLGAPFTESMFLLLTFACLYYIRIRKFRLACIMGGLAALTRNVGVLLVVPVFIELLYLHGLTPKTFKKNTRSKLKTFFKDFVYILLIPTGTIIYLFLNHSTSGDALNFIEMQQTYWHQSFGSYASSLIRTFEKIFTAELIRDKLLLWLSQFIVLIVGGITLPVICKKMRISYGAYAIVYLFVIFAPSALISGFRYYMALAIIFPALAILTKYKWVDVILTIVFCILMIIYSCCFSIQWNVL